MNIKHNLTRFGIGKRYHVNRKYKDQLFRFLFRDKKELLSLYNAIHSTNYTNAEDLTITTIEDVLYLGMKNDLSFLIGHTMSLYEHQSTYNPNMPLRGLFYFADLYRAYVDEKKLDIYRDRLILLPVPKYIIFYNGTKKLADSTEFLLSESFLQKEGLPALECRSLMLNINYGHNRELLAKCKRLEDYAFLIHQIKLRFKQETP